MRHLLQKTKKKYCFRYIGLFEEVEYLSKYIRANVVSAEIDFSKLKLLVIQKFGPKKRWPKEAGLTAAIRVEGASAV